GCEVERVAETVAFFEASLFAAPAVTRLAALTGLARPEAEAALRRHLGVCFDACHMAVEYEDAGGALGALAAAGVAIGKIQVSAGLEVALDGPDDPTAAALAPFAEGVYLHQVVERCAGRPLLRHLDLPDALAALRAS